jgi:hypothetical protein
MEKVVKASQLSDDLVVPAYERLMLEAIRAASEVDCDLAILYSALAVETVAGARLDEEYSRLLAMTPWPPHIRAIERRDKNGNTIIEDPEFKKLRSKRVFRVKFHELPLYVLRRSLRNEDPDLFKKVLSLHRTRNSIVHTGWPSEDPEAIPVHVLGVKEALECAVDVFSWFGVPGGWPLPQGFLPPTPRHD